MQPYPHLYSVRATAADVGDVVLESERLPALSSAPPREFEGPGDRWSPETLLVGAVADCLILTFRAIARSARFDYSAIRCDVNGRLDRAGRVVSFTDFDVRVRLELAGSGSVEEARRLLSKAKEHCLITNSLNATCRFEMDIVQTAEGVPAR